jgi:PAS domain S-box-containing protein
MTHQLLSRGADSLRDPERLAALHETGLLDTPPEEPFDRLTRLTAAFLRAPLALVNLVDDRRQFSKSCFAPPEWPSGREAPLADSFCKHAVVSREPLRIEDAREHPLVRSSAMVRDLGVASYLGVPLVTPEGHALGTLCVADFTPRSWGTEEVRALTDLAASALTEIRLRGAHAELERRVRERTAQLEAANRELGESEARFRLLVEGVQDYAILLLDMEGRVTSWNPGAELLLGYRAEEIVGRSISLFYPPEVRDEEPGSELRRAREEGRFEGEGWRIRKDGSHFWANVVTTPLRDEQGWLFGFAKVVRDLSERREAEEAILRLNAELEQRVRERTGELEAANRELESFSYSVSHDLRAPLRSIDGFGQALLEDYAGVLDETGRGYLQRVRSASQRMAQLIDDLLELSRVTRSEMRRDTVDLSAMAREIAAGLGSTHPERRVEWAIDQGVTARGDPRLLRQALENLLGNAWKYTGKQPDARIEFGVVESGAETVYFVRDNGAGFEMAYAEKLFTPFQRLHSAHEFEGTGIGLATVQRVLRRHGGRVWAKAEVGGGATFYFSLPLRGDTA